MKKLLFAIAVLCAICFCCTALFACSVPSESGTNQSGGGSDTIPDGGGDTEPDPDDGNSGVLDPDEGGDSEENPSLADFEGVVFEDAEFDFNGLPQSIFVSGNIPDETDTHYTNNKKTDAGTYLVTATLQKNGYRTKTLKANLTIRKIDFAGITFHSKTVNYDASVHSIEITGMVPPDCSVVYSGGSGIANNEAVEVGLHTVTATVTGKNYNALHLTATLNIVSREELLFTYRAGNTVYFQNPLDGEKLYHVQNGAVEKSSNDKPQYFTSVGNDVFFLSKTLFASGIALFTGGKSEILYEVSDAQYLITDGTYLFYAVDSLSTSLKKTTGIYKISIAELKDANAEPQPIQLTNCKAAFLQTYGGYVYFSNGDDHKKLHRISVNANNGVSELVYDYKVSDVVISDSKLFFTRGMTTTQITEGSAIYSYDLETGADCRVTYSKGKYLLPLGNEIYFVNTDMLTSTIFGDGIYKAPSDGSGWLAETFELLVGATKIVAAGENDAIYSLTTDGINLYYYRTRDKHLYRYNPLTKTETDLMRNFTPKEETSVIATPYGEMKEYRGYLYYTDLSDGGKLCRYDPSTGSRVRATGTMVADFAFDGNFLYYAGFRLTNCDIYRANLITGETVRISTDKGLHFAFSEDTVYYMNCKGKNTLNAMEKDGANDRVLFDAETVSDYDITVKDGMIYFVATYFYRYDPIKNKAEKLSEKSKPNEYFIFGDTVYFMNDLLNENTVASLPVTGGEATSIASLDKTGGAKSFFEYRGDVYYFARTGVLNIKYALYCIKNGVSEEITVTGTDAYYINSPVVSGDKVYFLDVWFLSEAVPLGSGKPMVLDMRTFTVSKA